MSRLPSHSSAAKPIQHEIHVSPLGLPSIREYPFKLYRSHSSLRGELSTNIRFPDLGAEDKNVKRMNGFVMIVIRHSLDIMHLVMLNPCRDRVEIQDSEVLSAKWDRNVNNE